MDYPTEEQLQTIKSWKIDDLPGLMEFVKPLWSYGDCGYWSEERNLFYLSTAGWSGNEDIIGAMQENFIWWSMFWRQSKSGGHYIFAASSDWFAAEHHVHLTAYGVGPLASLGNLFVRLGRWLVQHGGK